MTPILGVYPKKSKTLNQKNACTPMFIASLFTIAKLWKQIDKQIKKLWYIYMMEYYSAIKKNGTSLLATAWMDLEGIVLNEIKQRKTNTM